MKGNIKRDLIGNEGMVLLDTARRLIRRNAVDNLMKLVAKTHPADIAWVFRHFAPNERKFVFNIIAQTDSFGEFLSELDQSIMLEMVGDLTPRFMANIIKDMPSDDAADILERRRFHGPGGVRCGRGLAWASAQSRGRFSLPILPRLSKMPTGVRR